MILFVPQPFEKYLKITTLQINGDSTLNENIADNGGLDVAFMVGYFTTLATDIPKEVTFFKSTSYRNII